MRPTLGCFEHVGYRLQNRRESVCFLSRIRYSKHMDNSKTVTGWEVLAAKLSSFNGYVYVTGNNHETTDPLSQKFGWHINPDSLRDARFDFSACVFEEGAEARLESMKATAAETTRVMDILSRRRSALIANGEHTRNTAAWRDFQAEARESRMPHLAGSV